MGNALGRVARVAGRSQQQPISSPQALAIHQKEILRITELQATVGDLARLQDERLHEDAEGHLGQLIRAIETRPAVENDRHKGPKEKTTRAEKEAALQGRLATPALRSLLESVARRQGRGGEKNLSYARDIVKEYGGLKEDALWRTLRHCRLASVQRTSDGRLVAVTPRSGPLRALHEP